MINDVKNAKIIQLPEIEDERGVLSFLQYKEQIPFECKRIFYSYNIKEGKTRGGHAHKICQQLMIAIKGKFEVLLDDGNVQKTVSLDKPNKALYIPSEIWIRQFNFTPDAVCLVLASELYDENDYFRNYPEYRKYREKTGQ